MLYSALIFLCKRRTDRLTLMDTYQYNDSAGDPFHREPYCVSFRLHDKGWHASGGVFSF